MGKPVFATHQTIIAHEGATIRIYKDQAWDSTDPFVKANPDLFASEPTELRRTVVEEATAVPGEKRRRA